jgi:hypothetical protein
MSSKSHSLNLYDVQSSTEKFEIDVTDVKIDFKTAGIKSLVMNMPLSLIDAVGGDIASVSTKLHMIDDAIAAGNLGSAAASVLVQQNLTAYSTSNDASLATVSQNVTTNKAISDASAASDAAARVQLQTDVEILITSEENARVSDVSTLTTSLATEVINRVNAISLEASTRTAADTILTTALSVETSRIDAILSGSDVNLDSFLEVVNQYSNLNTSALAQIASLNTQLIALQAQVTELTQS